ncbi:MAG TPA: DUF6011 domain-containing protein [Phycisphaerae bacterium]|nr:DUF6011 domain-containing protein [Phycisphaerae bacterium]
MSQIRRSGPPQGAAPTLTNTDSRQTAGHVDSSLDLAQAVAVLTAAGLAVAGRCQDCGQALVSPTSIARARGPKCAAKARAVVE